MREINSKSIVAIAIIYVLVVGGYGVNQLLTKNSNQSESEEYYQDVMDTANAYVSVGDFQKAAEQYQKAAELSDDDPDTLLRLASSQHNAKQYADAEKTLSVIEYWGSQKDHYWIFRAENMAKNLITIENIDKAIEYSKKADSLITDKENVWLYLTSKAKIYLEKYKYYRSKRENYAPATQEENQAKETFLATLADLENISISRNDRHIMEYRTDLWNQYITFPNFKYQSEFENAPELEKIPYTQDDIERIKQHRPQDDFPDKQ